MANYSLHRYLMMTLDPVHIGTGGYRLGRVDQSIAREPGTNIPKIPGTSFSGALRQYAAYRYGKLTCAGKGDIGNENKKHCGLPTCPICYAFGHAKGDDGGYSGTVNIFDAQILFFPVYSMAGPVWVTTAGRLEACGFKLKGIPEKDEELTIVSELPKKDDKEDKFIWWNNYLLNLGWLMLDAKSTASIIQYPSKGNFNTNESWQTVTHRLVIATEKVFSQVVNSNLEVRTSVSINPKTGAAEEGALFTYEAIPRATWLTIDLVFDDYRKNFPSIKEWKDKLANGDKKEKEKIFKALDLTFKDENEFNNSVMKALEIVNNEYNKYYHESKVDWPNLEKLITDALNYCEFLGVGGMGTRGFGRVRNIIDWEVSL